MNIIAKFFHELLNPHCSHCKELHEFNMELRNEMQRCRSCESLERQLSIINQQNIELLNKLTNFNKPPAEIKEDDERKQVIQTRHVPWNVKRQMLESESRQAAMALRNAATPDSFTESGTVKSEVDKLEEVLGITNAGNS